MTTRAKLFSQLAKSVDASGTITSAGISSTVSLGATVYDSAGQLPTSGYNAGDQAFVISTSRLYINSGVGWYNVAVINNTPIVQSILDSDGGTTPFSLAIDGTPTTITITAVDSDGDSLTYSSTADSNFGGLATISQVDNVFTITPFSQDSATTSSGTITFSITDGINIANSGIQTFTLSFVSALWDETVLSIGTSSTNSLANSTFIDRSTSALTVTPTGSPVQTAFHPYLNAWSNYTAATSYLSAPNHADFDLSGNVSFTIEAWVYRTGSGTKYWEWVAGKRATSSPYPFAWSFGIGGGTSGLNRVAFGDNTSSILGTTELELNRWHHIAASYDGTTCRVFLDGVLENSGSQAISEVNIPLTIGNYTVDNQTFEGYISNLRLVKGTCLYTTNFTPSTEPLGAITNTVLLTCQSNRFIDNSLTGHTLTPNGDVQVKSLNPSGQGSEYAPGANKGSVYLNGSSSVDGGASINPSSGCCIEGWAYVTSVSSFAFLFSTEQGNSGFYPRWYVGHDNSGNWRVSPGDATDNNLTSYPLVKNQWNHWALTNDGSTSRLFVNGKLIYTKSVAPTAESLNFNISKYGDSLQYTTYGYISDFRAATTIPTAYQTSSTTLDTQVFTPPSSPGGISGAGYYLPMDNPGIYDKTGNHTVNLVGTLATSTTQTKFANTSFAVNTNNYTEIDFEYDLTADWTLEYWVYPTSTNTVNTMHHLYPSGNNTGMHIWYTGSGTVYIDNGSVGTPAFSTLTLNQWNHIAVVRSSGVTTAYLDGSSIGSHSNWTPGSGINKWRTGKFGGGNYNMVGSFENIQFLNTAKYTTNFTPPTQTQGRQYQAES